MKNKDGTLKCFGKVDMYQDSKPHTRHCIAMIDELKLCNDALRKECLKINKYNKKKENEMENSRQIKAEKLLHYSEREPKNFMQFEGFINPEEDWVFRPDSDGDCLFYNEPWIGQGDVRLLVVPGTNTSGVVRILDKFKAWIQKDFGQIGNKEIEQDDRLF